MNHRNMKILIICFCLPLAAQFDADDYSIIKNLVAYVTNEHKVIATLVSNDSCKFEWHLLSLARFPIIKGKQCPYFDDHEKYKSVNDYGIAIYKVNNELYYVGTTYKYVNSNDITVNDTTYYKVVAYRLSNGHWQREYSVMTLKCYYDEILEIQ